MRFSLAYNLELMPSSSHAKQYRRLECQAVAADLLGFDAIWLVERPALTTARLPATLTYLRSLSAVTNRIMLGTIVTVNPRRVAPRLADEIALLDLLSGGRVRLGMDFNLPAGTEPAGSSAPVTPDVPITIPYLLAVIEKLRREVQRNVAARSTEVTDAGEVVRKWQVVPAALQPLYLCAGAIPPELAATYRYPYLITQQSTLAQHWELNRRYRQSSGGGTGCVAHHSTVVVAATEQELQAQHQDLPYPASALVGTPQQVVDQLITWQLTADFDEVICHVSTAGLSPEAALRSIELLGSEVLPQIQPPLRTAFNRGAPHSRTSAHRPAAVRASRTAAPVQRERQPGLQHEKQPR